MSFSPQLCVKQLVCADMQVWQAQVTGDDVLHEGDHQSSYRGPWRGGSWLLGHGEAQTAAAAAPCPC